MLTTASTKPSGFIIEPLVAEKQRSFKRQVLLLILSLSAVRLILAAIFDLGNDESYYWLYMQQLQWSYYDHPSMVAVWGRIFTFNLALQDEVFLRLGSIVSCAFSSWFIYRATVFIHSEKAGWYSAVLYNTSFYSGVISGLLIMPDSPQMFFWTLSMWMLVKIHHQPKAWLSWMMFGIAAGFCIMSKVHGAFLWIGLGLYVLLKKQAWLKLPQLYAAALLTIAVASPILIWNIENDFATYNLHSKRVTVSGIPANYLLFLTEAVGQFLFNNPVNVILTVFALKAAPALSKKTTVITLLIFIGLPLILILLSVSWFRPVFPHWSGPAYVVLMPLAAIYLSNITEQKVYPSWIKWSLGAMVTFFISWVLITHFYPGTYGSKSPKHFGNADVTLDRYAWEKAGRQFTELYKQEVASVKVAANTPVVCNHWWGAHIEYYFCKPAGLTMIGLGDIRINHYYWLNEERMQEVNFANAYCIIPSDEYYDPQSYEAYYSNIELIGTLEVKRRGRKAKHISIYRLSGWKGVSPPFRNKH
jgi:hypothetical protein